ncbi:MAG: hypothetical protein GX621_01700 [Pirellulaceae bacterium]|nr:hypothetical protein [Pirellulaceae bacterium]
MIKQSPLKRSAFISALIVFAAFTLGCSSLDLFSRRSQSPDDSLGSASARLVGDLAAPYGMFPVRVEGVGMVTSLPDTGSDAAPSPERAILLSDMKARNVEQPSRVLARKDTALVMVMGILRPGIQKGDAFDIQLRVPSQSETTSLRGGWLLKTSLKEMAVSHDQQLLTGRDWGHAEGAILIDPSAEAGQDAAILSCRGRILGGGRALRSRSLGLVLKPNHQNVFNAARIESSVNKRFFRTTPGGVQEGMAKAISDQYVELSVHPRYKDNIPRYMQVVRSLALQESPAKRLERTSLLEKQLLDPITSAQAALQLEAIGRRSVDLLKKGLESEDAEVRFRSAEALAYLDQSEAAKALGEAARNEPAFRVFALSALAAMDDPIAYEQLSSLLEVPSAETRYGAFRALWTMNPNDHRVMGEKLGDDFSYHVLASSAPPMIHVTRSRRAEIVLFNADQRFLTPLLLEAGPRIRVTSQGPDKIAVSRYAVGEPDQKRVVSTKVDEVIRAIAELKGTYPDVVGALQQAKSKGVLASRFEVDAIPEAGRAYDRAAEEDYELAILEEDATANKRSLLDLLRGNSGERPPQVGPGGEMLGENGEEDADSTGETGPVRSFFARMTGRTSN